MTPVIPLPCIPFRTLVSPNDHEKLFYTGLLSCHSLADSFDFMQIVAFGKIKRWVLYFRIVL